MFHSCLTLFPEARSEAPREAGKAREVASDRKNGPEAPDSALATAVRATRSACGARQHGAVAENQRCRTRPADENVRWCHSYDRHNSAAFGVWQRRAGLFRETSAQQCCKNTIQNVGFLGSGSLRTLHPDVFGAWLYGQTGEAFCIDFIHLSKTIRIDR
jgi:hypothetical protein